MARWLVLLMIFIGLVTHDESDAKITASADEPRAKCPCQTPCSPCDQDCDDQSSPCDTHQALSSQADDIDGHDNNRSLRLHTPAATFRSNHSRHHKRLTPIRAQLCIWNQ